MLLINTRTCKVYNTFLYWFTVYVYHHTMNTFRHTHEHDFIVYIIMFGYYVPEHTNYILPQRS